MVTLETVKRAVRDAGYQVSAASRIDGEIIMAFSVESIPGTDGHPAYEVRHNCETGRTSVIGVARSSSVVIENDVSGLRVGTPSDMKVDARFVGRYQGRTGYLIHALRSRHYNAGWFLCDAAGGFIKLYPRTEKQGRKMLTDWLTKEAV